MKLFSSSWLFPISQSPIANGALLIDKNKIIEVGIKKDLEKKYPKAVRKHFNNTILLPGFINTHCHLVHSFDASAPRDFAAWYGAMVRSAMSEENKKWKKTAKTGIQELIRSGVTTVADSGPESGVIKLLKKSGLRGIFYQEIFGFREQDPNSWKNSLTEEKMHSRIRYGYAPHSPYTMPKEMFQRISRYCRQQNIPFTTHLAESKEEIEFFNKGEGALAKIFPGRENMLPRYRSSVEYLNEHQVLGKHLLAAHCVQTDDLDLQILTRKKVNIAYCPTSNQFLKVGAAPVKKWIDKNMTIGLGTDSAATIGKLNFFHILRDAALLGELSPEQVLWMATLGGAKAMGMDESIGSLAKGKRADLIAVKIGKKASLAAAYAQLVWKAEPKNLIFSMVDGKVLYKK